MVADERVLQEVAGDCRDAYIRERQMFQMQMHGDERKYAPSSKWDGRHFPDYYDKGSVWPKIARFMLEHRLDPHICMWARFQHQKSMNVRRPPFPNQVGVTKYLSMYEEATEEASGAIKQQLEFEKSYLATEMKMLGRDDPQMSRRDICETVLLDDTLPVTPLLRYCIADQEGFDKVKEWLYKPACRQYRRFPDLYDRHWASVNLPEQITKKVGKNISSVEKREVACNG